MAFIIFGGTGHIGNNLIRALSQRNEKIIVICRRIDESINNLPVEYVITKEIDQNIIDTYINKGDKVIDLIAYIDIKNKNYAMSYNINYLLTKMIVDRCLLIKTKQLIFFSSVDAIYKESKEKIVTEPIYLQTKKIKANYPLTKALATNYCLDIKEKNPDFCLSILYPSAVIGINDYKPSAIGKVLVDVLKNKMQFAIKGSYNFVDVEDVLDVTLKVIDKNLSEDFIISGNNISVVELYKMINDSLKRKKMIIKLPTIFAYLSIPFIPYLSRFVLKTITENHNYSSQKATLLLGYKITDFSSTLDKTVNWFKERI